MTSSDTTPSGMPAGAPPHQVPIKQGLRAWMGRILFGDDIFISYARDDGLRYAEALGTRLVELEYGCCFDQWSSYPNQKDGALPFLLRLRLVRSSMLIVIGTSKAAKSWYINLEIEEFLRANNRRGAPIRAIDVDGSIGGADWEQRVRGLVVKEPPVPASPSRAAATPSNEVLEQVKATARFTTRATRLRRLAGTTVLAVVSVLLVGWFAIWSQRQLATAARGEARKAQALANEANGHTRAALAEEATAKAAAASALAEAADAQLLAEAAGRRAAEALNNASSLEDAARARTLLRHDPTMAVRLATEAVRKSPETEQVQALRDALAHYVPKLDFVGDGESAASCVASGGRRVLTIDHRNDTVTVWDADQRVPSSPRPSRLDPGFGRLACNLHGDLVLATRYPGFVFLFDTNANRGHAVPAGASPAMAPGTSRLLDGVAPDGTTYFTLIGRHLRVGQGANDELSTMDLEHEVDDAQLISSRALLTTTAHELAIVDVFQKTTIARRAIPQKFSLRGHASGSFVLLSIIESVKGENGQATHDVESIERVDLKTLVGTKVATPGNAVLSPSGAFLATNGDPERGGQGCVWVRSTSPDEHLYRWKVRDDDMWRVRGLAFFPPPFEDQAVITWDAEGVEVWDPKTGVRLKKLVSHRQPSAVFAGLDGHRLFAQDGSTLQSWTVFPSGVPRSMQIDWKEIAPGKSYFPMFLTGAALTTDGGKVVYATGDRGIGIWSPANGKSRVLKEYKESSARLAVNASGTSIAAIGRDGPQHGSRDGSLQLARQEDDPAADWSIDRLECLAPGAVVRNVALNDEGARIAVEWYVSGKDAPTSLLQILDSHCAGAATTVGLPHAPRAYPPRVSGLAFGDHDKLLVIDTAAGIFLWDVAAKHMMQGPLEGHVPTLDASGRRLLSVRDNGALEFWERRDNRFAHRRTIVGASRETRRTAWSTDGRFAATSGDDNVVRVWDIERGTLAWSITGAEDKAGARVLTVGFRASTYDVVTVWHTGAVRIDPCELCRGPEDLVALARSQLFEEGRRGRVSAP